jgi:hypothetical protein
MILAPVIAVSIAISLTTTVSVDQRPLDSGVVAQPGVTAQQKSAALRRLIRSATDCVVRTVAADPRLPQSINSGDVTALIVDSMRSCVDDVRAMIDAHDRLYGEGSGEAFFMGPYLDLLPATVSKQVR